MNSQRLIDIMMLMLGVALVAAGMNASHSVIARVTDTLQHFTQADW